MNIPCEDCILFAICRASFDGDPIQFRYKLMDKCSLLNNYFTDDYLTSSEPEDERNMNTYSEKYETGLNTFYDLFELYDFNFRCNEYINYIVGGH